MRHFLFYFFLCFFVLFTIYYSLFTSDAAAAGEFSISYDNTYEVDQNLNFAVTQNIKITNLTTQLYASEFLISLGNIKINQVLASDETGQIPAEITNEGDKTDIKVNFTKPVVGKGKTKSFSLKYFAPELINKAGEILEISVPKLTDPAQVENFNLTLLVPSNFGPPAYITPEPVLTQPSGFGGKTAYFFDKSKVLNSAVSAAFGEKQIFAFNLKYHLNSAKSSTTEIALPPDNPYQKVVISEIFPKPENVRVDSDGNWLALYKLAGGKLLDVKVLGFVEVYPKPKFKSTRITKSEIYLAPQQFWEVNSEYFVQKSQELKTPRQIYDFVTSFLAYNQQRLNSQTVDRIGAKTAVAQPKNAVCMEFTDLFITLARSSGIPAREVNGFAVSENARLRPLSLKNYGDDILHAWPEYWDENLQNWVQVDPTWGSTSGGLDYFSKLDFSHIAFVHKGLSSTYPIPAGGYKTSRDQTGDVEVELAKNAPVATFEPKLQVELPKNILSGVSTRGKVSIQNFSNQALELGPLKLAVKNLIFKSPAVIEVGVLPPLATRIVEFEVDSAGFLTNQKGEVVASFGPLSQNATIQIRPSLIFILITVLVGGLVLFFSIPGLIFLFKKFSR